MAVLAPKCLESGENRDPSSAKHSKRQIVPGTESQPPPSLYSQFGGGGLNRVEVHVCRGGRIRAQNIGEGLFFPWILPSAPSWGYGPGHTRARSGPVVFMCECVYSCACAPGLVTLGALLEGLLCPGRSASDKVPARATSGWCFATGELGNCGAPQGAAANLTPSDPDRDS